VPGPDGAGARQAAAAEGRTIGQITGDARNADMFQNGRIRGRTFVDSGGGWDEDESDSTERNPGHSDRNQPRRGGELHSEVERYLSMLRDPALPPAPRTEVANYKAKRLHGPLGREGRAVTKPPPLGGPVKLTAPGITGRSHPGLGR
jgi:hypothetical protein